MKKLLIYAALIYGGYRLISKKKEIEQLTEKLEIVPQNVRNVKIIPGGIQLLLDLNLINKSDLDFSLNSLGTIKLTRINFFTANGTPIGSALPNITNINIPPNSNVLLPNVQAAVGTQNITTVITQMIANPDGIYTQSEIEILGIKYLI